MASSDLLRRYVLTVVCREQDEVDIRAVVTNSIVSAPLSFQGFSSKDLDDNSQRVDVIATLEAHPKYQSKVEAVASRFSVDKGASSVSWAALDTVPVPD